MTRKDAGPGEVSDTAGNRGRKRRGLWWVLAVLLLAGVAASFVFDLDRWGVGDALKRLPSGQEAGDTGRSGSAGTGGESGKPGDGRKILYYVDPMNPAIRTDKPGRAPCGMDYVPVYEETAGTGATREAGAIRIDSRKQQLIGVQVGEAIERPLSRTLRTVGRVTYDETRITHVHTKFSGYVEKVFVDFVGRQVAKGQPLISVYSPELVATQQELLIAAKSRDVLKSSPFEGVASRALSLYEASKERLRLWDISDAQIREIEKRGSPLRDLKLYATSGGFVLSKQVFEGQKVSPEMDLYTLADLGEVWVLADVFEYEVPMVRLGQSARMSLGYDPGRVYEGRVTYVYPELDPVTRTLKVRMAFKNPDLTLKPDMYVNVEFTVDYGRRLSVAQSAVLDSGSSRVVFIAGDDGYFVPRTVTLGARVNDYVIVESGLKPGDRVVVSANFLIDSESQLKSAEGAMGGGHAGHSMGDMGTGSGQAVDQSGGMDHSGHTMPGTPGVGGPGAMDHAGHSGQAGHESEPASPMGAGHEGHVMPEVKPPGSMDHSGHGAHSGSRGGMDHSGHTMPGTPGTGGPGAMDHSGHSGHGGHEPKPASPVGAGHEGHVMPEAKPSGSMDHSGHGTHGGSSGGMDHSGHTMPGTPGAGGPGAMDHSGHSGHAGHETASQPPASEPSDRGVRP